MVINLCHTVAELSTSESDAVKQFAIWEVAVHAVAFAAGR